MILHDFFMKLNFNADISLNCLIFITAIFYCNVFLLELKPNTENTTISVKLMIQIKQISQVLCFFFGGGMRGWGLKFYNLSRY